MVELNVFRKDLLFVRYFINYECYVTDLNINMDEKLTLYYKYYFMIIGFKQRR